MKVKDIWAPYWLDEVDDESRREKLVRALELLAPFAPVCMGVDVAALLASAKEMRGFLASQPEGICVPPSMRPNISIPTAER